MSHEEKNGRGNIGNRNSNTISNEQREHFCLGCVYIYQAEPDSSCLILPRGGTLRAQPVLCACHMQASLSSFFKKKEATNDDRTNGPARDNPTRDNPTRDDHPATATAATAPKRRLPASLQSPPTPAATASAPVAATSATAAPAVASPAPAAPAPVAPAATAPVAPSAPSAPATKPEGLDPIQPVSPAPASAEPVVVWMWQSGPSWTPYGPEQSALLEHAWAAKEPRASLDKTRHVDLHTMRQAPRAHF